MKLKPLRALFAVGLCALGLILIFLGLVDWNWQMALGGAALFFVGFEIAPVGR